MPSGESGLQPICLSKDENKPCIIGYVFYCKFFIFQFIDLSIYFQGKLYGAIYNRLKGMVLVTDSEYSISDSSPLLRATKGLGSFLFSDQRLNHILNFPLDCVVVLSSTI